MPRLVPQRLIALRRAKQLTRQDLAVTARVSERQLARIETAGEMASVRTNTLTRLAGAVDVDSEVLTGKAPLPDHAQEAPAVQINPDTLMRLRRNKRMSRRGLAQKSGISERHIARLETTRSSVRATTVNQIAGALQTDQKTLTSEVEVDAFEAPDVQMGLKISPQLRLAFDLVGQRYGISRRELVELAPLLFTLMAEGCLAWRRECLQQVEDAMGRLSELSEIGQLGFAGLLHDIETGCDVEGDSIGKADLLGDVVRRDGHFSGSDYPNRCTPFADYLCKLAEDLKLDRTVVFNSDDPTEYISTVGCDTIWGAEPYLVCATELADLAGDSKLAYWALAHGDVRLSQLPKELLGPDAKDARAEWIESNTSDETRTRHEEWEDLVSKVTVVQSASDEFDAEDADTEVLEF
ncbi:MAG: helix-turn-helix domain-containing protein [Rhodospirillaceae bacterium]|nr:helix-turn-helix domain-containing protein [Rhodospirillaceae bacterium]